MNMLKFFAVVVFVFASSTVAQYQVAWYTVDGGGRNSTGGAYALDATIGQPDAGQAMAGGAFNLTGGFWSVSQVCFCPGDMNGDGRKDGRDIQRFVNCLIDSANCNCADVDLTGGVSLNDTSAFVSTLLANSSCQ